jgi:hypothetical protein
MATAATQVVPTWATAKASAEVTKAFHAPASSAIWCFPGERSKLPSS